MTPDQIEADRIYGVLLFAPLMVVVLVGMFVTWLAPKWNRFWDRVDSPEGVTFSTKRNVAVKLMTKALAKL